jgi:Flp pilus assembly protein CpaB
MRRRSLIILGLVGIVIVIGILLVRGMGANNTNNRALTPTAVVSKTIIYAAQDIPQGTIITEDYLQKGQWPQGISYENLVTDESTIIGKRARINIKRLEPVLGTSVLGEEELISEPGSLTSYKIAPGKVAIAIPLSRLAGVANAIRNGDHILVIASLLIVDTDVNYQTILPDSRLILFVDKDNKVTSMTVSNGDKFNESPLTDSGGVLGAYFIPQEAQRPRLVSAVVVSDSKVLNVGNVPIDTTSLTSAPIPASSTPAAGSSSSGTKSPITPTSASDILVVEVTPEEAISLDFIIRMHGDLTYGLRPAGDTTPISLPSWDLKRLMENRKIDLPAKLNYGTEPRTLQKKTDPPFEDVIYIPVLGNDVVVQAR